MSDTTKQVVYIGLGVLGLYVVGVARSTVYDQSLTDAITEPILEIKDAIMGMQLDPQISQWIDASCAQYGVDANIAKAQCWAESRGDPNARNARSGASGLFQLLPSTFAGMGYDPSTILDPQTNIDAGVRYLAGELQRFGGDYSLALAAYNAGAGHVIDYRDGTNRYGKNPSLEVTGGIPDFRETQNYVAQILANAGQVT